MSDDESTEELESRTDTASYENAYVAEASLVGERASRRSRSLPPRAPPVGGQGGKDRGNPGGQESSTDDDADIDTDAVLDASDTDAAFALQLAKEQAAVQTGATLQEKPMKKKKKQARQSHAPRTSKTGTSSRKPTEADVGGRKAERAAAKAEAKRERLIRLGQAAMDGSQYKADGLRTVQELWLGTDLQGRKAIDGLLKSLRAYVKDADGELLQYIPQMRDLNADEKKLPQDARWSALWERFLEAEIPPASGGAGETTSSNDSPSPSGTDSSSSENAAPPPALKPRKKKRKDPRKPRRAPTSLLDRVDRRGDPSRGKEGRSKVPKSSSSSSSKKGRGRRRSPSTSSATSSGSTSTDTDTDDDDKHKHLTLGGLRRLLEGKATRRGTSGRLHLAQRDVDDREQPFPVTKPKRTAPKVWLTAKRNSRTMAMHARRPELMGKTGKGAAKQGGIYRTYLAEIQELGGGIDLALDEFGEDFLQSDTGEWMVRKYLEFEWLLMADMPLDKARELARQARVVPTGLSGPPSLYREALKEHRLASASTTSSSKSGPGQGLGEE